MDNNNEFTQYIENLSLRSVESRDVIDQSFYDLADISSDFKNYMNEIIERKNNSSITQ